MLIPFIKASPARLFPGINIGFAESNLFCWRTGVTWARSRFQSRGIEYAREMNAGL